MVTVAMAFMDLLSFFKTWLSRWVTTLKDWDWLKVTIQSENLWGSRPPFSL